MSGVSAVQVVFAVLVMNVLTFALWGMDKSAARHGRRRVPERSLLLAATFGGWIGAKLGQRYFRHKTRKEPFRQVLNVVPVIWLAVFGAYLWTLWAA